MAEVPKHMLEGYRVALRWRKLGKESSLICTSAQQLADTIRRLTADGWEPDEAAALAAKADGAAHDKGDYLEKELANGLKYRAGVQEGFRTWNPQLLGAV